MDSEGDDAQESNRHRNGNGDRDERREILARIFKNPDGTQVSLDELVRRSRTEGSGLLEPPAVLPGADGWTDDDDDGSSGSDLDILNRDDIWRSLGEADQVVC
mmetsp:Transcript_27963/g.57260  ORF Transcript_27963/g.57260 Transcript_27963/m.57260 type:complete len:103 (-) Transcript_27963:29-337(-)